MPKRSKSSQAPLPVESKRVFTDFVPVGLRSAPGSKRKHVPDGVDFSVRGHPPIRIHWDTILRAGRDPALARRLALSLIESQVGFVPGNIDSEARSFFKFCAMQIGFSCGVVDIEGSILESDALGYLTLFLAERIDEVGRHHGFKPEFDLGKELESAFLDFFVHRAMPDEVLSATERDSLAKIADASGRVQEAMLNASPNALQRARIPEGARRSLLKLALVVGDRAQAVGASPRKGGAIPDYASNELIASLVRIYREGTGNRKRYTDARQHKEYDKDKRYTGPLMDFIMVIFEQVDEATGTKTKPNSLGRRVAEVLKERWPSRLDQTTY